MKYLILSGLCLVGAAHAKAAKVEKAPECAQTQCVKAEAYLYQGDLPLCSRNPSYNLPATVNMPCQWGVFFDASYLYWYAGEGGLDVASPAVMLGGGSVIPPNTTTNILFPSFEYKSGFKAGLGAMPGVDNWVIRADYTYVRQEINSGFSASAQPNGTGVLFLTSWFVQSSASQQALACASLTTDWDLGIDWIDATLSRPHYMGSHWTVTPFAGLRSSWIRQSYHVQLTNVLNAAAPSTLVSKNHSHSWGIGPRGGLEWHWLTAQKFRFQGAFGADLLYTKYTTLTHVEDPLLARTAPVSVSMDNPTFLQPMAEANLGFAWAVYAGQGARIDFSAVYEFNLLWNQNLMRTLNDNFIQGVNPASNNLFLHGLTASIRADF